MTSQNIPFAFAITDASLTDSLTRSLRLVNLVEVLDETLISTDLTHYYGQHQTWAASPPVRVYVNGVLQTSGFTVDATNGVVTFASAPAQDAIVAASYFCNLFSAADYTSFIDDAFLDLEGRIGNGLDDTALPRALRAPIVLMAHCLALRALLSQNLENYRWSVDGKSIDKRSVAQRFRETLVLYENQVRDMLVVLRAQFLAEGRTVTLNIDQGLPPSPFSRYPLNDDGG